MRRLHGRRRLHHVHPVLQDARRVQPVHLQPICAAGCLRDVRRVPGVRAGPSQAPASAAAAAGCCGRAQAAMSRPPPAADRPSPCAVPPAQPGKCGATGCTACLDEGLGVYPRLLVPGWAGEGGGAPADGGVCISDYCNELAAGKPTNMRMWRCVGGAGAGVPIGRRACTAEAARWLPRSSELLLRASIWHAGAHQAPAPPARAATRPAACRQTTAQRTRAAPPGEAAGVAGAAGCGGLRTRATHPAGGGQRPPGAASPWCTLLAGVANVCLHPHHVRLAAARWATSGPLTRW